MRVFDADAHVIDRPSCISTDSIRNFAIGVTVNTEIGDNHGRLCRCSTDSELWRITVDERGASFG